MKVYNEDYLSLTSFGDCGVAVFRPTEGDRLRYVYETNPAQHSFNAPYQCGIRIANNGQDLALEGVEYQDGDVLVLYSDGFADNVFRSGYY